MAAEPPILEYAIPQRDSPADAPQESAATLYARRYAKLGVAVLAAAIFSAGFDGTWYFWERPRWVFHFEAYQIIVGPSGDPLVLGPTLIIRLVVVTLPTFLIWRLCHQRSQLKNHALQRTGAA